jgi:hypothetical protein
MCSNSSRDKARYSLVIMMNRNKAENIAAIVLLGVLAIIFVIQNTHALSTTCPGFVDNRKCLTIDKQSYQFGKQAGLIAFYQVDDSCDSTAPAHTNTDAYNGANETK